MMEHEIKVAEIRKKNEEKLKLEKEKEKEHEKEMVKKRKLVKTSIYQKFIKLIYSKKS